MADKDRKETETSSVTPVEKKDKTGLTDQDMSKISGAGINVDIGSFGMPEYSEGPNGS